MNQPIKTPFSTVVLAHLITAEINEIRIFSGLAVVNRRSKGN